MTTTVDTPYHEFMNGVLKDFYGLKPKDPDPKELAAVNAGYRRFGKAGKDIIDFARQDPKRARRGLEAVGRRMEKWGLPWKLDTVAKWFPDWNVDPEAFEHETKKGK